jgi:intein/homing endonuclease
MHFFATKEDLIEVLSAIETRRPIKYVKTGHYDSQNFLIYNSAKDFSTLGISKYGDHQTEVYLILDKEIDLVIEKKTREDGSIRYSIAHGGNYPNKTSICFFPGGFYKKKFLVSGHFDTIRKEKESKTLYSLFTRNFRKLFTKIGSFYVGKGVFSLPKDIRLVGIYKQPLSMDLIIPDELRKNQSGTSTLFQKTWQAVLKLL